MKGLENFIHKMTDGFVENGTICAQDKELYEYGLRQGLIMLCHLVTTIVIGIIFGMLLESIMYMLFYIPLRIFAGGFHTKTQLRCYFLTIVLTTAVLALIRWVSWTNTLCIGLSAIAAMVIFIMAPVEDANKPLDEVEMTVYRKKARIMLGVEGCLLAIFVSWCWRMPEDPSTSMIPTVCMCLAFCTLAGMLIAGKIVSIKKNVKVSE